MKDKEETAHAVKKAKKSPKANDQPKQAASVAPTKQGGSKPAVKKSEANKPPKKAKKAKKAASPYPAKLIEFMMQGWQGGERTAPEPIASAASHAARRQAISQLFPGETLVVPTGHEVVRANDTNFRFRPGSDFFYLTGNLEADCVLVLEPTKKGHHHVLYVEPNPGRSDSTFFTDRHKGELWVGPRLGVKESQLRFGVDQCRPLADLPKYLKKANAKRTRYLRGLSPQIDGFAKPGRRRDAEFAAALSEARLIKDEVEIQELEKVVAATLLGFEDVIRTLKAAKSEREVEVAFNGRARTLGNDVGYGTIAAAGKNACILHWTDNNAALVAGELLLLDAGVEGHALYTADITRTLPMNGTFSKEQRELYELVSRAQFAAFDATRAGNDFMAPNEAAQRVLAEGLVKLGILESVEDSLKPENQFQKRYTLHNTSHMLGIDVHDCAAARQETYRYGKLKPGMVLTIEPGLYFQPDDLTVPERYRGIGIRIEDDVLVTDGDVRLLSQAIPRTADEVEAWMARVWRS